MSSIQIKIKNLDKLRKAFKESPKVVVNNLGKAVTASIFEVEKNAVDSNFRFKIPRSRRSGQLQQSFKFGRKIEGLRGKIGPTVGYALYVHEGTSRGIRPNPFMERIAKNSEKDVQKHFEKAIDKSIKKLVI